jgi:hypothetical protein
MSQSKKKAVFTITNQIDKNIAHKQVRHKVKMELIKDEPDLLVIEADTRELKLEDVGTKIGIPTERISK